MIEGFLVEEFKKSFKGLPLDLAIHALATARLANNITKAPAQRYSTWVDQMLKDAPFIELVTSHMQIAIMATTALDFEQDYPEQSREAVYRWSQNNG